LNSPLPESLALVIMDPDSQSIPVILQLDRGIHLRRKAVRLKGFRL